MNATQFDIMTVTDDDQLSSVNVTTLTNATTALIGHGSSTTTAALPMLTAVVIVGNHTGCMMSDSFWRMRDQAFFVAYYVITPIFGVLGLTGHSLSLVAFRRQMRKDKAYRYQAFLEASEVGHVVAFVVYVASIKWWSGAENDGVYWYRSTYFFMWWSAHLGTPIMHVFMTISLLLSLFTALDRVLSLAKPHSHRTWNVTLQQNVAVTLSVSLGFGTSVFAFWRYRLVELSENYYQVYIDAEFSATLVAGVLNNLRNFLRMAALVAMIGCNVALAILYRSTLRKSAAIKIVPASNTKSYQQKMKTQRTLTLLTITECVTTGVGMTAITIYFAIIFAQPAFTTCGGLLMIDIVDAIWQLCNTAKFFVMAIVLKSFRTMIINMLPIAFKRRLGVVSDVLTVGEHGGNQADANSNLHVTKFSTCNAFVNEK